jgi:hypothetical protein
MGSELTGSIMENGHLKKPFFSILLFRIFVGAVGWPLTMAIIEKTVWGKTEGNSHKKKFVRADSAAFPASSARTNGRGVLYVPAQFHNISMKRKKSSHLKGYFLISALKRYSAWQFIFQVFCKRPALLPRHRAVRPSVGNIGAPLRGVLKRIQLRRVRIDPHLFIPFID